MSLRALIVDDEPDARENLRIMLEDNCPEVQVVAQAGSAEQARALIAEHQPQALFLDIKMPGEDGFSLLRSIAHLEIPVVFTTAYDEYALQAFKENALDYLENLCVWLALSSYPDAAPTNSLLGLATTAKTTVYAASWVLLVVLLAWWVIARLVDPGPQKEGKS